MRHRVPYGLTKRSVTGRIFNADAASGKSRIFGHLFADPNDSTNYLLSRVNINDVGELRLSALETNMFEIEMMKKALVHTETSRRGKKKVCCVSEIVGLLFPGALTASYTFHTHCVVYYIFINKLAFSSYCM